MKAIFEDSSILVLDKPPGLVVDKSETQQEGTLENWLEDRNVILGSEATPESNKKDAGQASMTLMRQGIVHRLDKDTSGVIVIAKNTEALENLQNQFASRVTKKEYIALVHGLVEKSGIVKGAIGRNPGDRTKFIVLEGDPTTLKLRGAKEAETEYESIKSLQFTVNRLQEIFSDFNKIQMRKLERMGYNQFTLVRCFPKTGRTHQIRVHLKHIGYPIVADSTYVGRKMYRLDHRFCPRQFLHAAKIGFNHPDSGEWVEFESKLPDDLEKALSSLRGSTKSDRGNLY